VEYGAIISAAWRITQRYRGLWVLGLFAGGANGSVQLSLNSNNTSSSSLSPTEELGSPAALFAQVSQVLDQILPFLIVFLIAGFIVYLLFWLLSIACKGAIIAGGAGALAEQPVTLGSAWSMGRRAYGRLFVLDLGWHIVTLVVFGLLLVYAISRFQSPPNTFLELFIALGPVIGLAVLLGLVISVLSVVIGYAQRAIVLDQASPGDGLNAAIALARQRLGTSIVLWLLGIVLTVAGGIALVIALLLVAIPVLIVAAIIGFILSLIVQSAFGFAVLIILVPCFLIAALVGGAALNTFLWHYWTAAYLRMTRPVVVAAAPAPGPAEPSDMPPPAIA
jgi:hypothetical protein